MTSDAFDDISCVILLGELGLGKSRFLDMELERLELRAVERRDVVHRVNLEDYSTDVALARHFEQDEAVRAWRAGSRHLYLLLDSFDEALASIPRVADVLATQILATMDRSRLRIRIASRNSRWIDHLRDRLERLWTAGNSVDAYVLAPLRECDVRVALPESIDAERFFAEIDRLDAWSFADKPSSLLRLVTVFAREGSLPPTKGEVYEESLEILCDEVHREARFTAAQRLAASARVAACCVFSGRFAIVQRDAGAGEIDLHELVGYTESARGNDVEVSEALLDETLATGLFEPGTGGRVQWRERPHAEFLAARYLDRRGVTAPRIFDLLPHVARPGDRLVPWLYQTAAWLCTSVEGVFEIVARTEPTMLLNGDHGRFSESQRAFLVDSLLALFLEKRAVHSDVPDLNRLDRLWHPHLADQLRPCVAGRVADVSARSLAFSIAERCRVAALANDILAVVLDEGESPGARTSAAQVLGAIGDADVRRSLLPVSRWSSVDNELRAAVLGAVYPHVIGVAELLPALSSPQPFRYDLYTLFLTRLPGIIPAGELSVALEYIATHAEDFDSDDGLSSFAGNVLERSLDHAERIDVANPLAIAVRELYGDPYRYLPRVDRRSFAAVWLSSDEKRAHVLGPLLDSLLDAEATSELAGAAWLFKSDLAWLVRRLETETSEEAVRRLAVLTRNLIYDGDPESVRRIASAVAANPLTATLNELRELGDVARNALTIEPHRPEVRVAPPPATANALWVGRAEHVADWLLRHPVTSPATWASVGPYVMSGAESSTWYSDPDLTRSPLWEHLAADTRSDVLAAAESFLRDPEQQRADWIRHGVETQIGHATFAAIRFLTRTDSGGGAAFPIAPWVGLILPALEYLGESASLDVLGLLHRALADDPERLLSAVSDHLGSVGRIADVIVDLAIEASGSGDGQLVDAILASIRSGTAEPYSVRRALTRLIEEGIRAAFDVTVALVTMRTRTDATSDRRVSAAVSLLTANAEEGFDRVWPALSRSKSFGLRVLSSIVRSDISERALGARLNPDQIVRLYLWMERHLEDEEIQPGLGAGLSDAQQLTLFKRGLVQRLTDRGTVDSVTALERLAAAAPRDKRVAYHLLEARQMLRKKLWNPVEPVALLDFVRATGSRIVADEDGLLDLVVESLRRLESALHRSETPAIEDLWEEVPSQNPALRPRRETLISNYVKRHLERELGPRGVVLGREVEVYISRTGRGGGERTDIHVDAFTPDRGERRRLLTVVIEVKGCWNPTARADIDRQLARRYLRRVGKSHGIYLLAWFDSPLWWRDDPRHHGSCGALADVRAEFDALARALSVDGLRVEAFVLDASFPGSPQTTLRSRRLR